MKDLTQLIRFEDLLQEAHNALVAEEIAQGGLALGYTCYYIPVPLLNLGRCFSVRLRAPRSGSADIAGYYLTTRNCPFSRSLLERAIEGGYNFLGALIGSETCAAMDRAQEHFTLLDLVPNPSYFTAHLDAPLKTDDASIRHYRRQLQLKVLDPLAERYGVDTSEESLRKAIAEHNHLGEVIRAIGDFRKLERPPITSYEFHVICLVAQVCPYARIIGPLEETLDEVKRRKADPQNRYRARIVLVGSEVDDPALTKLIEECGLYVAADRYCYGSLPEFEEIRIKPDEDALTALSRHYLTSSQCPRFMNEDKVDERKSYIRQLVQDYHAQGVVFETMKFCEFWGYERVLASYILSNEMDIPCCTVEHDYILSGQGQLRTRFQAFGESLELKRIQKQREAQA